MFFFYKLQFIATNRSELLFFRNKQFNGGVDCGADSSDISFLTPQNTVRSHLTTSFHSVQVFPSYLGRRGSRVQIPPPRPNILNGLSAYDPVVSSVVCHMRAGFWSLTKSLVRVAGHPAGTPNCFRSFSTFCRY